MRLRFWRRVMWFSWTLNMLSDDFVNWAQSKYWKNSEGDK